MLLEVNYAMCLPWYETVLTVSCDKAYSTRWLGDILSKHGSNDVIPYSVNCAYIGRCKSWNLDWTCGRDNGLDYGLIFELMQSFTLTILWHYTPCMIVLFLFAKF